MKTYTKDRYFKDGTGLELQTSKRITEPQSEHLHEFIEIVYILGGTGVHGIDGVEYKVSRGSLLFINYRQVHYFKSENGMEIQNILIHPEWLSDRLIDSENAFELLTLAAFSHFQKIKKDAPLVRFDSVERLRVERLIAEMIEEKAKKAAGYDTVLKAQVNILLTMIFRKMSQLEAPASELIFGSELLDYIKNHSSQKLTLGELARSCFYNPSYFSRLFHEQYGITVTEFINQSRLEKAMALLLETNLSAEEIALQAGFSSKSAFYRLLREKTGLTPQGFRAENVKI